MLKLKPTSSDSSRSLGKVQNSCQNKLSLQRCAIGSEMLCNWELVDDIVNSAKMQLN